MDIHIRISFDVPRGLKRRILLYVAVPLALIVGAGALVYAGVPNTFMMNDVLSAQKMNDNFSALDTRLTAIEMKMPVPPRVSESAAIEHGPPNEDFVYQGASLSLTPGTWLIHASATLTTTTSVDAVQMGLWNDTASTDVTLSRSPLAATGITGNACDGVTTFCALAPLTTASIVTVAADTTIKLKAYRNGVSTVYVGKLDPWIVSIPPITRLTAVLLY